MSKAFHKFIDNGDKGSKKKERIRQEKKQMRKEKNEYFEKKKSEARSQKSEGRQRSEDTRYKGQDSRHKPGGKQSGVRSQESGRKNTEYRGHKSEGTRYKAQDSRYKGQGARKSGVDGRESIAGKKSEGRRKPEDTRHKAQGTKFKSQDSDTGYRPKVAIQKTSSNRSQLETRHPKPGTGSKQPQTTNHKPQTVVKQPETRNTKPETASLMPLNKFIAHAGVCSRRDAAEMVKAGKVVVNGQVQKEPGTKVSQQDEIKINGKKISVRRNLVYILLNKPKDYITTTEDPEGRKTVLDIVRNATDERVYPIGRLDRNTTGVLLLTNDGELSQKLAHPSYQVKKIYEVKLDKPLTKSDFDAVMKGITLEDGFIAPDALAYADSKDKTVIGIEIHSGRNRIVRRIFEHLGYDVRNLDRVMYANLTKKNVERGKWRMLSEKEVRLLKFLNASYTRK